MLGLKQRYKIEEGKAESIEYKRMVEDWLSLAMKCQEVAAFIDVMCDWV